MEKEIICKSCKHFVRTKLSKRTFFCNQMTCNFLDKKKINSNIIELVEIHFSKGKENTSKQIAELFNISITSVSNILSNYIKRR